MLKIQVSPTRHVFIDFKHERYEPPIINGSCLISGITRAWVYTAKESPIPVGIGMAMCSVLDNFNRAKGRKFALANALKQVNLSLEERKALWEQYFSMVQDH